MQSDCVTPYIKELKQLKLWASTTVDKFITKKDKKKCWMFRSLRQKIWKKETIKSKVPAATTHILPKFSTTFVSVNIYGKQKALRVCLFPNC